MGMSGSEFINGTDCQWSRWEASDIDGQTREGETSGKKASQAVTWTGSPKGE